MIDKQTIGTPTSHYGSPKAATRGFLVQRVTGVLNIVFTVFFAWFLIRLAGTDRADLVGTLRNPLVAIMLALLIINVCLHMRIGVHDVIEDYVHEPRTNRLSLMLNTMYAIAIAAVSLLAIAKIVFWG